MDSNFSLLHNYVDHEMILKNVKVNVDCGEIWTQIAKVDEIPLNIFTKAANDSATLQMW